MRYRQASTLLAFLALPFVVRAQLITRKESARIDALLTSVSASHKPATYLFTNVNLISMEDSTIIPNQDLLVENGLISKVSRSIEHEGAIRIEGTGKFLMPGLTDMHIHLSEKHPLRNTWLLLLLLHGVTTVRDMHGEPAKLYLRERIKRNEILAPNLYQTGPIINGIKDNFSAYASTPEEGREAVIHQKQSGYDFIKVYDGLKKDVYQAIVEAARQQNLLVVGHVPDDVSIDEALSLKQNSIEHLTGYFEWNKHQVIVSDETPFFTHTSASTTWNCPTLYNHLLNGSREKVKEVLQNPEITSLLPADLKELWTKRMNSTEPDIIQIVDRYGDQNFQAIKAIAQRLGTAGARFISGTDAGNLPFIVPGFSLLEELRLMSDIGFSNYEVLKMTTQNAATAMNKEHEFGTLTAGKRADILLLDRNPLENIQHLTAREGVMVRGIWLSKAELTSLVDRVRTIFSN